MSRPRKIKDFPVVITAVLSHTDGYGCAYSPTSCVLAEELREKYGHRIKNVRVYRKTISWTDRETGDRYRHNTPEQYIDWTLCWDPYAKALEDGTPLPEKPPTICVKLVTADAKVTPGNVQAEKNQRITEGFSNYTRRPVGERQSLTR